MRKTIIIVLVLLFTLAVSIYPKHVLAEDSQGANKSLPIVVMGPHDGELDPHQFQYWGLVNFFRCPSGEEHFHLILKNPDVESEIKWVEAIVIPGGLLETPMPEKAAVLIAYYYIRDGVEYVYSLRRSDKRYVQIKPELGEKKVGV